MYDPTHKMTRTGKSIKTESVFAWVWEQEQGFTVIGPKGSLWGDGNILKLNCDG